jgi:hypothetical protein
MSGLWSLVSSRKQLVNFLREQFEYRTPIRHRIRTQIFGDPHPMERPFESGAVHQSDYTRARYGGASPYLPDGSESVTAISGQLRRKLVDRATKRRVRSQPVLYRSSARLCG